MLFLREVPTEFIEGVASGIYKVTGSVVREVSSGRGVSFLQETTAFQSLMGNAIKGASATLSSGFSPLGLASVIQNQQITSRLLDIQSTLALLQFVHIGTLAVSGLSLGVSTAGFAVMLHRLSGIEKHLGTIEAKIDRVTQDRRADDVRIILADVRTQLNAVEVLSARSNKVTSAEAAEQAIATSAGRLEAHFERNTEDMQNSTFTVADMDLLWTLAAAIRVCHDARQRVLYTIDELSAARISAERGAQRLLELSQTLSPDAMARLCALREPDVTTYSAARQRALPQAEALLRGLRDSVVAVGCQSDLANELVERRISGPAYLADIAEDNAAPLVMLPIRET